MALVDDHRLLEEGLSLIKRSNLHDENPVKEMYGALERQYQQAKTIKLQGKDGDHVQKVLQDSNFFCILTRLVSQALCQSRTKEQKRANLNRVYKWYKSNIHKLHYAEQPPFRHQRDISVTPTPEKTSSRGNSAARLAHVRHDRLSTPASEQPSMTNTPRITLYSNQAPTTSPSDDRRVASPQRPRSVTFNNLYTHLDYVKAASSDSGDDESSQSASCKEGKLGENTSKVENDRGPRASMLISVAGRSTPDYHRVDESSYMDTASRAQSAGGHTQISVVSQTNQAAQPLTPAVNEYIQKIQSQVNKVQGHPSDVYPELFTTQIIAALVQEIPAEEKSEIISPQIKEKTIDEFFTMMADYKPSKVVRSRSALKARKDRRPRPKSSLSQCRPEVKKKELELQDIVGLVDFASAEISYEKESGLALNRPKTAPVHLRHSAPLATRDVTLDDNSSTFLTALPTPREAETPIIENLIDWRGTITPSVNEESQQADVFKNHSFVKASHKMTPRGRSAGACTGGYRPKTASSDHSWKSTPDTGRREGVSHPPQAASNNLAQVDRSVTEQLFNVKNLKQSGDRKIKSAGSELHGQDYLDYLSAKYSVPPSSVYEYESYAYENYEPPQRKPYSFTDKRDKDPDAPPITREYLSFVSSIHTDRSKIMKASTPEHRLVPMTPPDDTPKDTQRDAPLTALSEAAETLSVSLGDELIDRQEIVTSPTERTKSLTQSPFWHFSSDARDSKSTPAPRVSRQAGGRGVNQITFDPPFSALPVPSGESALIPITSRMLPPNKPPTAESLVQPIRTAPSIPSLHGEYGSRSPRHNVPFSREHEKSALRQLNAQEYLRKVNGMRAEDQSIERGGDSQHLANMLTVQRVGAHAPREGLGEMMVTNSMHLDLGNIRAQINCPQTGSTRPQSSLSLASRASSAHTRPIPQYQKADPWQKTEREILRQREAAAAVSIQKIFRGYVARNVCLKLRKDYREAQENKRLAAIRIQRLYRGHVVRRNQVYSRPIIKPEMLDWAKHYKSKLQAAQAVRTAKMEKHHDHLKNQELEETERTALIGPHVEIYQAYHQPVPPNRNKAAVAAAFTIQRYTRGMLTRNYFKHIKEKALQHASSWKDWIAFYKRFLKSILIRRGEAKPNIEINLQQMERFMDHKKRYEGVFERRAFGGELDEDELTHFFKECDLMPAEHEINHAIDLVFKGKPRGKRTSFRKKELMDVVFEIYKPEGTGMSNDRKSSWLNPIVDGEDAMKLMGSDIVEPAPLGPCLQLVASSIKERRDQAAEQERLYLIEASKRESNAETTPEDYALKTESAETESIQTLNPTIFSNEPLHIPNNNKTEN